MLWTLHNRASEAQRPDAWLRDEDAVRIYRAIDYDYLRAFGKPDGSHAMRSLMFDEAVRAWMQQHPGGTVVELACGLETQFRRVDDGRVRWVCVDLPEAMAVRERYLPSTPRCRGIARDALDPAWMADVTAAGPIFVSMQGLLMYLQAQEVRALLIAILDRFPGSTLMFDTIPPWFSRKTLAGYWRTPHYRTPPMPWGIGGDELESTLRSWGLPLASVESETYRRLRVFPWGLVPWIARLPGLGRLAPRIVRVVGATR